MANDKTNDLDDLREQFDKLRADMRAMTETVGKIANGKAGELAEHGRERAAQLGDTARGMEAEAIGYVRTNPFQALAIAAGLGLAVGFLSRR